MRKSKGFTLIELLVVIAIIGLLAAIVLTSLSSARTRAKAARVQTDMAQVRTVAETVFNAGIYPAAFATVTYTGGTVPTCTGAGGGTNTNLISLDMDVRVLQGGNCLTAGYGVVVQKQWGAGADATYRALALLPGGSLTTSSVWWCVDNSGSSKPTTCTGLTGNCLAPLTGVPAVCP